MKINFLLLSIILSAAQFGAFAENSEETSCEQDANKKFDCCNICQKDNKWCLCKPERKCVTKKQVQKIIGSAVETLISVIDSVDCGPASSLTSQVDKIASTIDSCVCPGVQEAVSQLATVVSVIDSCVCPGVQEAVAELATVNSVIDSCVCPGVQEAVSQLEIVNSKIDLIVNTGECASTSALDACCQTIVSQIDMLDACAATPIFAPTTITQAGYYCLANNISSGADGIDIASGVNNVTLDLNNHTITLTGATGSAVAGLGSNQNITVKNGTLIGNNGATVGVDFASSSTNVTLDNLTTTNFFQGLSICNSYDLNMDQINSYGNDEGALLNNVSSANIANSSFNNNQTNGLAVVSDSDGCPGNPSSNLALTNNSFNNNTANGTNMVTVSGLVMKGNNYADNGGDAGYFDNLQNAVIDQSNLQGLPDNPNPASGLYFTDLTGTSSNILVTNSNASGFTSGNGFQVASQGLGVTPIGFANDTAAGNGGGFDIAGGYPAILENNTATNNTTGFRTENSADTRIWGNSASDNGSNYTGFGGSPDPITSSATSYQRAANIDTTNTTPDLIPQLVACCSQVDECCFSVNSKIDTLSNSCGIISITAPTIITIPGSYCLADNISGDDGSGATITINSSDVTLDLAGHTIDNSTAVNAITLAGTVSNIVIKNGSLVGNGSAIGITIPGTDNYNITVDSVTFQGQSAGIQITNNTAGSNINGVAVQNCKFIENAHGIFINASQFILIQNCYFSLNTINDINSTSNSEVQVIGSTSINSNAGFSFSATDCLVQDCAVFGCGYTAFNFYGGHGGSLASQCTAQECGTGFLIAGTSNKVVIEKSTASNGGTGFDTTAGFGVLYLNNAMGNPTNFSSNQPTPISAQVSLLTNNSSRFYGDNLADS